MNKRVFMPAEVRLDISDAAKFGEVIYLFEGRTPYAVNLQKVYEECCKKLESYRYDPDEDFIALTGQALLVNMLASCVLAEYGQAKFIVYTGDEKGYVESAVTCEGAFSEAEEGER